jgi:cleavage and polyadenylation specificity factor subunit 2
VLISHSNAQFEDYEVAKVSGQIHIGTNMSIPVLELPIKDEQQVIADVTEEAVGRIGTNEISYTLRTTTQSVLAKNSPAHLPQTLFIGDLRLNALKAKLSSMSIPAEFAGEGMLICGPGVPALLRGDKLGSGMGSSVVAVRKTAEGKIEMEGNVGEIYYNVRSALYGNFAQVVM